MSPAELRSLGTGVKTYSILRSNVYGWFERIDTGLYGLSARGRADLAGYPELAAHYSGQLKGKSTAAAGRGRGGRTKKKGGTSAPPRPESAGGIGSP